MGKNEEYKGISGRDHKERFGSFGETKEETYGNTKEKGDKKIRNDGTTKRITIQSTTRNTSSRNRTVGERKERRETTTSTREIPTIETRPRKTTTTKTKTKTTKEETNTR